MHHNDSPTQHHLTQHVHECAESRLVAYGKGVFDSLSSSISFCSCCCCSGGQYLRVCLCELFIMILQIYTSEQCASATIIMYDFSFINRQIFDHICFGCVLGGSEREREREIGESGRRDRETRRLILTTFRINDFWRRISPRTTRSQMDSHYLTACAL